MNIKRIHTGEAPNGINFCNYKIVENINDYIEKALLLDDFNIKKAYIYPKGEKKPLMYKTMVSPLEYMAISRNIDVERVVFNGWYKSSSLGIYFNMTDNVLTFVADTETVSELERLFNS